ncbi:hypothetical protein AGMMS50239_03690 [Bacteroidia bacterium]|nr:hypothetical protein AGMMS50239_03690 [Bacteroidia bacterium]
METKFTEQESLAVINEMIARARNNVQKGAANNMIYNGYAVAFVAVLNFILLQLLPEDALNWSFSVWWLMLPSAFIDYCIKKKLNRSAIVRTQIDGILTQLWRGFSISVVIFLVLIFGVSYAFGHWRYCLLITPVMMLMVAIAEFVMAKICNYKPFFWGAVCFWAGILLCLFSYCILKRGDLHFLILAVCMIIGFVIPGYQLNSLAKKAHV